MASNRIVLLDFSTFGYVGVGFASEFHPRNILAFAHNNVTEKLQHIFLNELQIKSKECSVLIIEDYFLASSVTNSIVDILFKYFHVNSVSVQSNIHMAIVASGLKTGLLVVLGETDSHAVCFAKGRPLFYTLKSSSLTGRTGAVNEFRRLMESKSNFIGDNKIAEGFFVGAVCHKQQLANSTTAIFRMAPSALNPTEVNLCDSDRQSCLGNLGVDALPLSDICEDSEGVERLVLASLSDCNTDVRLEVARSILFCGSGSTVTGLASAICGRASELATVDPHFSVANATIASLAETVLSPVISPFSGPHLVWIGASVFASLQSSQLKFAKLQDLLARHIHHDDPIHSNQEFLVPDWTSLSREDREFFNPGA